MSSTLRELGDFLESRLVLYTQSSNLFLGWKPDAPDAIIVISQYPGGEPEHVQEKANNIERTQIQVLARGPANDYDAADRACALAWNALAPVRNLVIGGTKYHSIMASSRGAMGTDTNDRPLVGFNATVEKEVSLVS